jgi:hypothetical protein
MCGESNRGAPSIRGARRTVESYSRGVLGRTPLNWGGRVGKLLLLVRKVPLRLRSVRQRNVQYREQVPVQNVPKNLLYARRPVPPCISSVPHSL